MPSQCRLQHFLIFLRHRPCHNKINSVDYSTSIFVHVVDCATVKNGIDYSIPYLVVSLIMSVWLKNEDEKTKMEKRVI